MSSLDEEALRQMVREVLREVVPGRPRDPGRDAAAPDVRPVRVGDDHELGALVSDVVAHVDEVRSGRRRYRLVSEPAPEGSATAEPLDVDTGAVTERLVVRASREQRRLRIGPRAVVTPLARDRARSLGVTIERTSTARETP